MIGLPYGGLKPLTTGVADGNVGKYVVVVVGNKGIGKKLPERMVRYRAKYVVAKGTTATVGGPGWIVEKGSEVLETALQMNVLA